MTFLSFTCPVLERNGLPPRGGLDQASGFGKVLLVSAPSL